jgi:hypothetical protein
MQGALEQGQADRRQTAPAPNVAINRVAVITPNRNHGFRNMPMGKRGSPLCLSITTNAQAKAVPAQSGAIVQGDSQP